MPVLDLRLVPPAAACWLAAIVLVAVDPRWSLGVAGLAGLVSVVGLTAARGRSRRPAATSGLGQLVLVALVVAASSGAVAGQALVEARGPLPGLVATGADVRVTGQVVASAVPVAGGAGGRSRLDLAVTDVEWTGPDGAAHGAAHATVLVLGGGELHDAAYGSVVTVPGTLRALEPGDDRAAMLMVTDDPRAPDGPVVAAVEPPGRASRAVNAVRADFMRVSAGLSAQARGLVPGVGIGDTSMLAPALDEALVVTSLTHITAVSGSHFAIIAATVFGLCSVLRAPRWARVAVAGVVMTGFVLLVHPEPSVLRAAVMGSVALVAMLLGRPSQAVAALCVTVVVLLLVDPWLARSYGFTLSVLATAGLVLGTAPVARALARVMPSWLALAVAVPVAAQLACAPVVVLLDPSVSAYAVPANLLAAPALVPATILSVVSALLSPWWPAGALAVGHAAGWSTWWIAEVAEVFAVAPHARIPWMAGPAGALALALLTVVVVLLCVVRRPVAWWVRTQLFVAGWGPAPGRPARSLGSALLRLSAGRLGVGPLVAPAATALRPAARAARPLASLLAAVALGLVAVVVVALVRPPWAGVLAGGAGGGPAGWPPAWEVAQCDVGQGDAMLVRTAPGHAVMVDVGPAGGGVQACLEELGIEQLDLLVLTHFHADHVGGLADVLAVSQVHQVLVSPVLDPDDQAEVVLATLADASVRTVTAEPSTNGTVPGDGEVAWRVLSPVTGTGRASPGEGGANDGSVALELRTAHLSVVALGDLEAQGQAAVLQRLRAEGVQDVDVVKMAHHGSAVQDAALARLLSPRVTLVSSGAGNTYGHPNPDAVALYRGVGSAILRTDTCGTVGLVVQDGELLVAGRCS